MRGGGSSLAADDRPMRAMICDICEQRIRTNAFELLLVHGDIVRTETGSTRLTTYLLRCGGGGPASP